MKKLLFLFFIFPLHAFCQIDTIPKNADRKYEYSEVVKADSLSANALYSNTKLFIVKEFNSGKDVTQLNDANSKTVVGTGTIRIYFKGIMGSAIDKFVKFKIYIQAKDGRYKYTINNFELEMIGTQINATISLENQELLRKHYLGKKQTAELDEQVPVKMKSLIADLKKDMISNANNF